MNKDNKMDGLENIDKKPHISGFSVRFPNTLDGAKKASKYLKTIDREKDFWFHPSSYDIINHANKLWDELNAH